MDKNIEVSELYQDLPIKITADEVEKFVDLKLDHEIKGESINRISTFLDTIHRHIYYFLIFNTGVPEIKTRIINKYKNSLEKPIKVALLTQAQYLLSNGNIELFNGVVKTVYGVDFKETVDLISKIVSPSVINILIATKPNILYAGE